MLTYKEYLDAKGKDQDKPIISVDGDTVPASPPKPQDFVTKGPGWNDTASVGNNQGSYSASSIKDTKKGFADLGDEKLKYKPGVSKEKAPSGWKENHGILEVINDIKEKQKISNEEVKNPILEIKRVSEYVSENENLLQLLVREIKKSGNFNKLAKEVLSHDETFKELANQLTEDERTGKVLARAIQEITAEPAEKDEEIPKKRKVKKIADQEVDMGNSDVVQTQMQKKQKAESFIATLNKYLVG